MSRFDITLGLVAAIATIGVLALYGLREEERMAATSAGWDHRSEENGAVLYHQLCQDCHGFNAAGGICPPLDETSGLYGGGDPDLDPSVACRLLELGWEPADPYGYVTSVIQSGRQYSTRPIRYPGNRIAQEVGAGTPTPPPLAAMPAWSEDNGGPLRQDQIEDIAAYLMAFGRALPDDPDEAKALACDDKIRPQTADEIPSADDDDEAATRTPSIRRQTATPGDEAATDDEAADDEAAPDDKAAATPGATVTADGDATATEAASDAATPEVTATP